jgi:DNA-binding NtrC family response regulator
MSHGRLVVVEDNEVLARNIVRALEPAFSAVESISRGDDALERLADSSGESVDVVLTDLRLPGADGVEVVRAVRRHQPHCAVLLMTAFGSVETAVLAMREGAVDFLQKPFELDELEARIEKARRHARLEGEVRDLRSARDQERDADHIIGTSPAFKAALDLAARVAPTRSTVLLTGETGTGKELVAALVHASSPRTDGPFVKVNCAALPETLLESELFGHERGAFTSADRLRIGRFEQADGGTLFLDEVGDMSLATQAKLLRVLQDQEFQRLGGTTVLRTDVRIVAATNRDLEAAIASGDFREDLYFRLNVITIPLPPLRERPEDVERLAAHFLETFRKDLARTCTDFLPEAMRMLKGHSWPGNVRELRNVIERAVLMAEEDQIQPTDLHLGARSVSPRSRGEWQPDLPAEGLLLDDIEAAVVREALDRSAWVQKDAAAFLGVTRRKLNYMIQRIGITHPSWRRNRTPED